MPDAATGIDPRTRMRFTWYRYYDIIIGLVLMGIIMMVATTILGDALYTGSAGQSLLLTIDILVVSYLIPGSPYAALTTPSMAARTATTRSSPQ